MAAPFNLCATVAGREKTARTIRFSCRKEMKEVLFWETFLGDYVMGNLKSPRMVNPDDEFDLTTLQNLSGSSSDKAKQEYLEILDWTTTNANIKLVRCMCKGENLAYWGER